MPGLNGQHRTPRPPATHAAATSARDARDDAAHQSAVPPPIPRWPRTDRPLNIAILGWAWLSLQSREGSGYNLNASELARGLALSGHNVTYLQSGMAFSFGLRKGVGTPRIRQRETWGAIKSFELVNSPNLAPAYWNFGNLERELADSETSDLVARWLDEHNIDVVHIHSQEGYALDLIPGLRHAKPDRPIVVTLHNYWFACPQVDLLYKEEEVCLDYAGGRKCAECLPIQNVAKMRRAKAIGSSLEYALGLYRADVVRKTIYGLAPTLKSLARCRVLARFHHKSRTPAWLSDPELGAGFEVRAERALVDGEGARSSYAVDGVNAPAYTNGHEAGATPPAEKRADETAAGQAIAAYPHPLEEWEEPRDYARVPLDTNEQMLSPEARTRHLTVLNNFGTRRHKGIEALNHASLVTAPSDYLRRVHVAMGVDEARTRRVLLGQPHFDQIHRIAKRSPFYSVRPWDPATARRPLRFCFMGTTRPNKGLVVLTRAIPLIAHDLRERCHITIHAAGHDFGFRKRLSVYPEVTVYGGYDLLQLVTKAAGGGEYDVGLLPHIWLENSPLVLLENLHAGKFVISSRLGGPADWIVEPTSATGLGNGLLFPGGDEAALARCIERCIRGDVIIPSAREVHEVSIEGLQSYPGHVAEVEGVYNALLGNGAPAATVHTRSRTDSPAIAR